MTILVSHQAVPPHFTTKLRPCLDEVHVEVTQSQEITFRVEYVDAIMFAKISGEQLPGLLVPGCGLATSAYTI